MKYNTAAGAAETDLRFRLRVTDPSGDHGTSACQPDSGPVDITLNQSRRMTQRFGAGCAVSNPAFALPRPQPIIPR
ncbi:MAG: hypothetical protein AMXMBFR26_17050 [Porticoccaceae bacterium]